VVAAVAIVSSFQRRDPQRGLKAQAESVR
jgi:hypothetical protein